MKSLVLAAAIFAAAATGVHAQSVQSYGDEWYRAEFWSGEYPGGFTVLKDTTLMLRPELLPSAEKTVACDLRAKATYHPWNPARALSDGLRFVSFTEIDELEIAAPLDAVLYGGADDAEKTVTFAPGARWRYLAYYAEGTFLMEYEGEQYTGDQSLFEASKPVKPNAGRYEEWLRINCPNNTWGWLFMPDLVTDDVTFRGPNIGEYGTASDLE